MFMFTRTKHLFLPRTTLIHPSVTDSFNIHFNIIIKHMPGSSRQVSYHNPVCVSPLPHTCHMPRPLFFIWSPERQLVSGTDHDSFLQSHITSSFLDPNIYPGTTFWTTLNLRSSPNVSDRTRHNKLISVYFKLYILRQEAEDRWFWTKWQQAFPELILDDAPSGCGWTGQPGGLARG